ncbi:MAG TPA: TonB-dependent receptor [Candidatus Rubrimentiphilum sp.]|nr:TonB-dependent receptor [Candidatus Rubrimentiphilum sp.]
MSKYIRILCVLALAVVTVGPVSAATVTGSTTLIAQAQSASVSGRITDSQTGGPVVNATVSLKGPSTYTTTTDASGSFQINNVTPGVYSVSITKTGYNTLTQSTLAVLAGTSPNISGQMQPITFTTLRTIASVRSTGRGTFNVTPASINVVTAQTLQQQGQTQVMQVLNQTPGIVANFPSSSANGAAPGSITFPNIRGALSFETASLVDGHPVSVGSFGDYVSTFVPAFMLGDVEIIKGPGVESPNVNYAIGGTVNYTTKEPTYTPQGQLWLGADTRGSSLINFDFTGTAGRLGYAFAFSNNNLSSALEGNQALFSPSGGIVNFNGTTGQALGFNDSSTTLPGTISTNFTNFNLLSCCQAITDLYQQKAYLAKLRYKMSPVTSVTFTYLGSQSYANQNGNTGDNTAFGMFSVPLGSGYNGAIPNGSSQNVIFLHAGTDREVQNEPILQGDLRTSSGNDTLLLRYYAAGIHRLINQGGTAPNIPEVVGLTLNGTDVASNGATTVYNNQTVPVALFNYFNQAEDDVLHGWSAEWSHPFSATNSLTAAVDQTSSSTVSYSVFPAGVSNGRAFNIASITPAFSLTIPKGSTQLFTTGMLRLNWQLSPKWNAAWANYYNIYTSTYPTQSVNNGSGAKACQFTGANCVFATTSTNHWDTRAAFEYRPNADLALRFSAGSAIAPPYLQLLSGLAGAISYSSGTGLATQRINSGGLLPETAFGYDAGGDYRFRDGITTLSGDIYLTNLRNHFLTYTFDSGTTCPAIDPVSGQPTPAGCAGKELFFSANRNLANARMEGIELSLRRRPLVGFGYVVQGSTQRGYAYALPACFYSTTITAGQPDCTKFNTNLAIIPGQNFTGNGISGNGCGCNGFSNQAIPYMQGYAELNYTFPGGASAYVGDQFMGKNNSLAVAPFWILNAGVTLPFANGLSLQVNGFNLGNTLSGVWPNFGSGIPIPIAGLPPQAPAGSPLFAATQAQVLGPSRIQFQLIKKFGGNTNP